MKLYHFSDPGHGWLKVRRSVLAEFVDIKKVTSYSYAKNDDVYLEEDCDAPFFINALKKAGIEVVVSERHSYTRSRIRNYPRFAAVQGSTNS